MSKQRGCSLLALVLLVATLVVARASKEKIIVEAKGHSAALGTDEKNGKGTEKSLTSRPSDTDGAARYNGTAHASAKSSGDDPDNVEVSVKRMKDKNAPTGVKMDMKGTPSVPIPPYAGKGIGGIMEMVKKERESRGRFGAHRYEPKNDGRGEEESEDDDAETHLDDADFKGADGIREGFDGGKFNATGNDTIGYDGGFEGDGEGKLGRTGYKSRKTERPSRYHEEEDGGKEFDKDDYGEEEDDGDDDDGELPGKGRKNYHSKRWGEGKGWGEDED